MKRMPMSKKNEQAGRKTFGLFCILTSFLFLFSDPAKANWAKGISKDSWWYDLGNGDYYKNSWQWIDGNGDKISECYYFDQNGWMYANTTTPDGYTVDDIGRWVVNGVPQEYVERNTNTNTNSNTNLNSNSNNNTINTNNHQNKMSQALPTPLVMNQENDNDSFEETNDEYREELIELVNEYREENGLTPFDIDEDNDFAQIRAKELPIRFSHIRPNGKLSNTHRMIDELVYRGRKKPKDAQ